MFYPDFCIVVKINSAGNEPSGSFCQEELATFPLIGFCLALSQMLMVNSHCCQAVRLPHSRSLTGNILIYLRGLPLWDNGWLPLYSYWNKPKTFNFLSSPMPRHRKSARKKK